MDLYINSAGFVSAAGNNAEIPFDISTPTYNCNYLTSIEPPYNVPPMQLRRMSKAVRMGIGASNIAMKLAGIEKPDAIITGTTMGCMNDTEHFLGKMVDQDEQMLTPTSFIQSTHNTVAGQVALLAGCHGHNHTYVHRGHSFEHAMVDTQLYLKQHPGSTVLTGGIDELTKVTIITLQQCKLYSRDNISNEDMLLNNGTGNIPGEGSAFFTVTDRPIGAHYLHIKDLLTFTTHQQQDALQRLRAFVTAQKISIQDIDLVMMGIGADKKQAAFYEGLTQDIFKDNSRAAFKHLSGEYGTASSFALALLMEAMRNGKMPEAAMLTAHPDKLKRLLLVNSYMHYYSFWYIELT